MISLLTRPVDIRPKEIIHYKLNYATKLVNEYLNIVKKYYKQSGFYVKRPNKLVTLIEASEINIHNDELSVLDSLRDKTKYLANELGFIDNINLNSDPFLNTVFDDVNEFFIVGDNMKKSLTCIYTNITSLFLTHPKRYEKEYDGDEYNVYIVDPIKLGMDYYKWARNEMITKPENYSIDPAKFVYTRIITNTIKDIFKHSIFNRYIALYNKTEVDEFNNFNPFYIKNIDPLITSIQNWYIDEIKKNSNITYQELLSILPDFTGNKLINSFKISNVYFNRKSYWVMFLARVEYFKFLLKIVDRRRNKDEINDLKLWLKLAERQNFLNVPNNTVNFIISEKIKQLHELLKNK